MMRRIASFVLPAVVLLAACASPEPRQSIAALELPTLPQRWHNTPVLASITRDWWRAFGSDELSALVQAAQAQSHDVTTAVARVRQAEASARMAGAALLPVVTASVGASRKGRLGGHSNEEGNSFGPSLSASYEVDLWGRLGAERDGAAASLQASAFDRDAVALTVTAGVASAWLRAVALSERLSLADDNLKTARRLLVLIESRARAGGSTALEVAQQRTLVASQRRTLAALRQQADDARTAVTLLLGQPEAVSIAQRSLDTLTLPSVAPDMPSALLTRRPDIASAEARLAAADADVAAARAAMLPGLSLTAGIGTGGTQLRQMLDNPVYSLAAALAAPIFNGGRLAAARDLGFIRK